jgi:TRAP-type C4-dicarboxylate transport system permease small subunit
MFDGQASPRRASLMARVETGLMCVLLLGSILLAATQILLRNVFSFSLLWADELIRFGVLWLAMIGAMAASSEGRHLAIGIVPRYFPEAWHRPARVLAMLFAALISGVLAWQTFRFVRDTLRYGDTVLGGLPAWPFQLILPLGFGVMCLRFLRQLAAEFGLRP